jgi:hypothetical protein
VSGCSWPSTRSRLSSAPKERQGTRRIAQRIQAYGQIAHASERIGMLLAQHPLAALERAPKERQGPCEGAGPSARSCALQAPPDPGTPPLLGEPAGVYLFI